MKKKNLYYPVFLRVSGRVCVVVGGGMVALRKVRGLLGCGAVVKVVSPALCTGLRKLADKGMVLVCGRQFQEGDLNDAFLAVAATDDPETNRRVAELAHRAGVLVNVADCPQECDFIVPAAFSRGDITVAVSTSGTSPALARKIRDELAGHLGKEYAMLALLVARVRSRLGRRKIRVSPGMWQKALDLEVLLELIRRGEGKRAASSLFSRLAEGKKEK
ncbi:MAG: bifunctional precorrin-2 dehydrogenase/sirohydrochlorin ferrochelatase [Dehalococcoidales bacterium]|nr:bifunctional precorrin-2 dehydrogenase/sirohydrochlorin ferrochelatase [Dehalococcoidales bacterium]